MKWMPLIFACTWLSGCGGSSSTPTAPVVPPEPVAQFSFRAQGLNGLTVERLYQQQDKLLALTSDGLYQQQSGSWRRLAFAGAEPRDLAFITEMHWLAAVSQVDADGVISSGLHETFDGGASWTAVNRPFGEQGEQEEIFALRYDSAGKKLYATGIGALAVSADLGISWQLLDGGWRGFGRPKSALALDPKSGDIWWGGQGALEDGVLMRYQPTDGSSKVFKQLLPDPSVFYNVRFGAAATGATTSPLYACGEGGIVYSADRGASWRNLLGDVNYRFYFDVALDPQRPGRLYTAGWDKKYEEPQPLILQWSDDNGQSWQRLQHQADSNFYGGVRSLLLVQRDGRSSLYLGLYKGGIIQVEINR